MLDCFYENVSLPLSNWPPVGRSLTGVFERPTMVAKKFMTRATEWLMDPNGDACAAWPRLVTSLCPLPPGWSPPSPPSSKSSPISSSSSQQHHIHHHGQLGDKFMCFPAPTTAKDWELEGKRLVWKNIQLLTFMNTLSAVVQQDPFESPRKRVYQKTSEFPPWRRYPTRDASQAETVRGNALMCLWLSPRRPQATGISYFLDCIVLNFCILYCICDLACGELGARENHICCVLLSLICGGTGIL